MAWYDDIANTTKGNVQGLINALKNPQDIVKQGALYKNKDALAALLRGDTAPIMAKLNEKSLANPMEAVNAGLSIAPFGITTWHGSPHVFDKFDLSKARTGHGAEAYGHGAYLSEAMDLAKGFQPRSNPFENAVGKLSERAYDTNNYAAGDIYDSFLLHRTPEEVKSSIDEMYQGADAIKANQALNQATKLYQTKSKGGLYKVDLPDEHLPYFLDWDKYLHDQPKPVYDALMKAGSSVSDNFTKHLLNGAKGEDIYTALINAHQLGKIPGEGSDVAASQIAAANFLNSLGVKGVKYFDKSSPGSGQGTNNYVVHDPEILSILERNSVSLKK